MNTPLSGLCGSTTMSLLVTVRCSHFDSAREYIMEHRLPVELPEHDLVRVLREISVLFSFSYWHLTVLTS